MSLTVSASFGINDITGAPQALLQGGPFHNSIIELTSKDCSSVTITEDGTQAIYMNTGTTNAEDQHIFTCESSTQKG